MLVMPKPKMNREKMMKKYGSCPNVRQCNVSSSYLLAHNFGRTLSLYTDSKSCNAKAISGLYNF